MDSRDNETPPTRSAQHAALAVFLGNWKAEGTSFGGTDQTGDNPKTNGEPWMSTHTGYWYTGEFFLIQDERARPGGTVFDTLSIMGVDVQTGEYFARSFENHGFYRHYELRVDGRVWSLSGTSERARIEFSEDGNTQTITWEWRPNDVWLPLCDRIAVKIS